MLIGEEIGEDDIALWSDWLYNDWTVPWTSTVLKNKVFVFGGF